MGAGASAQSDDADEAKRALRVKVFQEVSKMYEQAKAGGADADELYKVCESSMAASRWHQAFDLVKKGMGGGEGGGAAEKYAVGDDAAAEEAAAPIADTSPDERALVRMRTRCAVLTQMNTVSRFHEFVVAVDGTEASVVAFEVMMSLRRPGDTIKAIHMDVTAALGADSLDGAHLKPKAVADKFEHEMAGRVPVENYKMLTKQLQPGESIRSGIVGYVNKMRHDPASVAVHRTTNKHLSDAHMFCCGFKPGTAGHAQAETMGSTTDFALRDVECPAIVAKKLVKGGTGGRTFVVAVTGQAKSHAAYEFAQALLKPNDHLTVVMVHDPQDHRDDFPELQVDAVKKRYEDDFASEGYLNAKFVQVPKPANVPIRDHLREWIEDAGPDFVCLAATPGKSQGESSTDYLVENCGCNFIIARAEQAS